MEDKFLDVLTKRMNQLERDRTILLSLAGTVTLTKRDRTLAQAICRMYNLKYFDFHESVSDCLRENERRSSNFASVILGKAEERMSGRKSKPSEETSDVPRSIK